MQFDRGTRILRVIHGRDAFSEESLSEPPAVAGG